MPETPKPKPPTKHVAPKQPKDAAKKPFVRPEHLTDRPLKDNEGLIALRRSMESHPSNHKRTSAK